MSSSVNLSTPLLELAGSAGYEVTTRTNGADDRTVFTTGLGEITFLIGLEGDGLVVVNESERLQAEYLVFAAPEVTTVEKYLSTRFGPRFRVGMKFPRIRLPVDSEHVAPGFYVESRPFRGGERLALIADDGTSVAWSRSDPIIAAVTLTELSYHMNGSSEDVVVSYLDPTGSPMFDRFVTDAPRG